MQDSVKETVGISIPPRDGSVGDQSPLLGSNKKFRFPTISNSLLRTALDCNFLTPEQRESIIKNPNQLTILRARFDLNSPRTYEAVLALQISSDDLEIKDYKSFCNPKRDPLHNLVLYLLYLTNQYKILTEVLKKRNQIKHVQLLVQKQTNSKNIKFKDEHNVLLTEVPESRQIVNCPVVSGNKKEQFDKKLMKESQNYSKFIDMELSQVSKQEEYYGKTAPQMFEKSESNKQKQLDRIKKKLKRKNYKVEQICQKVREEEEHEYLEHNAVIENMEKKIQSHQERKQKLLLQSQDDLIDQLRKKEDKEKERWMKRQISIQQEENMISSVMEQIRKKSDYLSAYLSKRSQEEKQKQELNLKAFENKQSRLQGYYVEKEKQRVHQYVNKSSQRQDQLMKHEKSQIKYQKTLSLKNSRVTKKLENYLEHEGMKRMESQTQKIQENDEKLEKGMQRHQSMIDLRKSNISLNNQTRFKVVRQNQMEQMLQKIYHQDQVLKKSVDISKKNEKNKREQEELEKYKKEQLIEYVQQRSQLINKYS